MLLLIKRFFPLIMQNKIWLDVSIYSGDRKFWVPDNYELNAAGCGIEMVPIESLFV